MTNFEYEHIATTYRLRRIINQCQNLDHRQQVAYSTYHDCLTQVCFECKKIRSQLRIYK